MNAIDIEVPFIDSNLAQHGGLYKRVVDYHGAYSLCREGFLSIWDGAEKRIFLGYASANPDSSVRLVREAEERLGLRNRSVFNVAHLLGTSGKQTYMIAIDVPAWWRSSLLRRSVYTALLKAGLYHPVGDFDTACGASIYFSASVPALHKFLGGCTELNNDPPLKTGHALFTTKYSWQWHMQYKLNWDRLVNPLIPKIREKAYYIWEANGKPFGRDKEFWEQAERETPKD